MTSQPKFVVLSGIFKIILETSDISLILWQFQNDSNNAKIILAALERF